jgi:predicted TIM-barrel fold metal-dependent hydrolase
MAIKAVGEQASILPSDFPHNVNSQTVRKQIHELREREEVSAESKHAILRTNAARFYKLEPGLN